ncbi:glycerol-3-phosphate 1-O-acyltransferase [Pseudonocardia sp.]|uniref:glycerol-3-phosphate 1-O-acyltransferase n=1 Tax=Pseudonocardia sp. TaxID=60912 RepID=UPI0031FDC4EC
MDVRPVGLQDDDTPVIMLVDAATAVERGLVEDWMRQEELRPVAVLPVKGPALAQPLVDSGEDAVVAAVRVAWLPRERNGQRRVRWADVVSLRNPRHPPASQQARIVRREPDRVALVVAEPATVGSLRARFAASRSDGSGATSVRAFGDFVARQAALALDRAERALVGDRYKVPRQIVEAIEGSPQFRREVTELAASLGRPEAEVAAKAQADLHGLVASMSPMAVDLLTSALRPLHARAWDVQVDTAGLEKLRECNRRHALVFLPSHRSYADPLLLADVLAEHDFPRNHVLGGDNLRFWPVGPLARRAGVVFIRRSFGDDEIYKLAVREYFAFLLAKRFNLEWYMEGGRSRTGKLRPPRYGLLAYVVDAVKASPDRDVQLVPVSIVYDQLPEVGEMAAQDRGTPKTPESFRWLVGYARSQGRPLGRAHVTFGEPLALDRWLAEDDSVPKVAFEVCHRINRVTPATPMSLVTLAMLGAEGRGLTLEEGRTIGRPVIEYLNKRGLPVTSDVRLGELDPFQSALAALVRQGVVTEYPGGAESVYAINPDKHREAAFYRNASIHFLVNRAIVELALLHAAETAARDLQTAVWDEALRLRDLLKFEFFFARKREYADEVRAEAELMAPGWEQRAIPTDDAEAVLFAQPMLLAPRVLRPFVEAYRVVAEQLVECDPAELQDHDALVARCLAVGLQQHARGRIVAAESISAELFAGALRLASNRGLSDTPSRKAFAYEVSEVDRRIGALARMATRLIPGEDPSWTISNA